MAIEKRSSAGLRRISKVPTIVDVELPSAIGKSDSNEPTLLMIDGVRVPESWDFLCSVRVFINNPSANGRTSIDHPSYAGSFHLSSLELAKPQDFVVDISEALTRQSRPGAYWIRVTLVLGLPEPDRMPNDIAIRYERIYIGNAHMAVQTQENSGPDVPNKSTTEKKPPSGSYSQVILAATAVIVGMFVLSKSRKEHETHMAQLTALGDDVRQQVRILAGLNGKGMSGNETVENLPPDQLARTDQPAKS